jgi:hypothetical protein
MPRHKKKQPSDDNVSTTSLTRAERAKVLEEKRRAAVSLAQEKRTNPAPASPPSIVAQPIVMNDIRYTKYNDVTSLLSTGVSPRLRPLDHARLRERVSPHLPPFDHARLRELVQYKSYADQDDNDCDNKNEDDYDDVTTTLMTTVFPWPVSLTRTMMEGEMPSTEFDVCPSRGGIVLPRR